MVETIMAEGTTDMLTESLLIILMITLAVVCQDIIISIITEAL